ncbi:hypothetical protein EVAR_24751_1 [Eumeta japonica]|uniref:Uncharacterized protein n=1 Tax=Eumeta variegata TaxID=151549 RepID=A0A4C1VC73_EUMVA|nr:hypothetical protein EVAR_24751_1 [Eumeta japonica]
MIFSHVLVLADVASQLAKAQPTQRPLPRRRRCPTRRRSERTDIAARARRYAALDKYTVVSLSGVPRPGAQMLLLIMEIPKFQHFQAGVHNTVTAAATRFTINHDNLEGHNSGTLTNECSLFFSDRVRPSFRFMKQSNFTVSQSRPRRELAAARAKTFSGRRRPRTKLRRLKLIAALRQICIAHGEAAAARARPRD